MVIAIYKCINVFCLILIDVGHIVPTYCGRTGSALVWQTRGRVLEPRLLLQVLRFVGRVCTVQYVEIGGVLPMRVEGSISRLDLRSLTVLSVADCGRLQLGVLHWATAVYYCK